MANRVAVVTGASRGIGKGIAMALAKNGYDIGFSYRSAREEALKLKERIQEQTGRRCEIWYAELEKPGTGPEFVEKAAQELGGLDVFVNNAGMTRFESILDLTEDGVNNLIALDMKNYIFCTQAAARIMVRNHTRGSIIQITSTRAERAYPMDGIYGGVKAAITRMSESAALDLAPYGIRVNCVAPGAVAVRSKEELMEMAKHKPIPLDFWDRLGCRIPLERVGTPEDVGNAVVFLASKQAEYITGATIRVDGGLILPGIPEVGSEGWGGKRKENTESGN